MKRHLKRMNMPQPWKLLRKDTKFITRPHAGSHPLERGIALATIIRDYLHLAKNTKEVRAILSKQEILINGKRRRDPKYNVGFMDVISIPLMQKFHLITLDTDGFLTIKELAAQQATQRFTKVTMKKHHQGKFQIGCLDGTTLLVKEKAPSIGDTLILSIPENKLVAVHPLVKGAHILIFAGKTRGVHTVVKDIKEKTVAFEHKGKIVETNKDYALVITHE